MSSKTGKQPFATHHPTSRFSAQNNSKWTLFCFVLFGKMEFRLGLKHALYCFMSHVNLRSFKSHDIEINI